MPITITWSKYYYLPLLQIRKLKLNKVKVLAQDHQHSWDSHSGHLQPKPLLLTFFLPAQSKDLGSSLDLSTHELCVFLWASQPLWSLRPHLLFVYLRQLFWKGVVFITNNKDGSALIQKQNFLRQERESGGRRQKEERHVKGRPCSKTFRTMEKAEHLGLGTTGLNAWPGLGILTIGLQLTMHVFSSPSSKWMGKWVLLDESF